MTMSPGLSSCWLPDHGCRLTEQADVGFVFHDRSGAEGATETSLALDTFPSPAAISKSSVQNSSRTGLVTVAPSL